MFSHRKLLALLNILCLATFWWNCWLQCRILHDVQKKMSSVTYFWALCTCSTQNEVLLRHYEGKSFPKTGMVRILQAKSFLSWKLLFFFAKKLASILPCQQDEWNWLTQVQLHGNFQAFATFKIKQLRNRSIDAVSFIMKTCFPGIGSGSLSSSGKMAFWRASELLLGMQWEDGEGRGCPSGAWGGQGEGQVLGRIRGISETAGGCEVIVDIAGSSRSAPFIARSLWVTSL